jgi:transposase-like protein
METEGIANAGQIKTLIEAVRFFSDLHVAHTFFANMRWPEGAFCPRCGSTQVRYLAKYRRYQCSTHHDSRQFTVKTGTVMEDSPLGLDKWAVGLWLEANAKNSISSYEVHRALGITQKSAWFMQQRIRLAMQQGTFAKLGVGGKVVEADETYIGGKARNMHKAKRDQRIGKGTGSVGKAIVAGLLERKTGTGHSKVRTAVIPAVNRESLHPLIRANVAKGSMLSTDALHSYKGLGSDFEHKFIDHAEAYVKGNVHTNGMENFWSLLKRAIGGTHVAVEPFHLFRYVDAQAFRYNNRKANDGERFVMAMQGMVGKRLTYKGLIGQAPVGLPPQVV